MSGSPNNSGFSLIEVALAIGVFALAIVSILGVLGPAVEEMEAISVSNEANDVVSRISEALPRLDQDSDISTSSFDEVFGAVASEPMVLYAFVVEGEGFQLTPSTGDVSNVIGRVFAIRLTVSGVNPSGLISPSGDSFTINGYTRETYPEAYLALRVDLHHMPTPEPGTGYSPPPLTEDNFLFSYHTAINR